MNGPTTAPLPTLTGRIGAALLAVAFVLGGGGSAVSGHACPHHAPDDGDRVDVSAPVEGPAPEAPCTCVGTCHGTAAAPLPAPGPAVPAAEDATERPSRRMPPGRPAALASVEPPTLPRSPPRV